MEFSVQVAREKVRVCMFHFFSVKTVFEIMRGNRNIDYIADKLPLQEYCHIALN